MTEIAHKRRGEEGTDGLMDRNVDAVEVRLGDPASLSSPVEVLQHVVVASEPLGG